MLFGIGHPSRWMMKLSLRPYGKLEMNVSSRRDALLFENSTVAKARWTHIALVWHYGKGVSPAISTFLSVINRQALAHTM